eukprot:gene2105-1972_t
MSEFVVLEISNIVHNKLKLTNEGDRFYVKEVKVTIGNQKFNLQNTNNKKLYYDCGCPNTILTLQQTGTDCPLLKFEKYLKENNIGYKIKVRHNLISEGIKTKAIINGISSSVYFTKSECWIGLQSWNIGILVGADVTQTLLVELKGQ